MTPDPAHPPDAAVLAAGQAVLAAPHDAVRHDDLARALLAAGDFVAAEEAARTAVALAPDDPGLLVALGAAQAGCGRPDQARRTLLTALAADPDNRAARTALADLVVLSRRRAAPAVPRRAVPVPALLVLLAGSVLLALRMTGAALACLALATVLLVGGFPQKRSDRR